MIPEGFFMLLLHNVILASEPVFRVEMDAKKNALGAEDIAKGVFIPVGSIKAEPKNTEIPTWFYVRKELKKQGSCRIMPSFFIGII
jgi:hypothetical protein